MVRRAAASVTSKKDDLETKERGLFIITLLYTYLPWASNLGDTPQRMVLEKPSGE